MHIAHDLDDDEQPNGDVHRVLLGAAVEVAAVALADALGDAAIGLAAAGGMLAQYQGYSDVGMGTGMVVIGLASVIIGEVLFGTGSLMRRLIAVALGAVVYRMVIGVALYLGMPPTDLKLVSAVIVTIALAMGMLGENFSLRKKKAKGGEKNA